MKKSELKVGDIVQLNKSSDKFLIVGYKSSFFRMYLNRLEVALAEILAGQYDILSISAVRYFLELIDNDVDYFFDILKENELICTKIDSTRYCTAFYSIAKEHYPIKVVDHISFSIPKQMLVMSEYDRKQLNEINEKWCIVSEDELKSIYDNSEFVDIVKKILNNRDFLLNYYENELRKDLVEHNLSQIVYKESTKKWYYGYLKNNDFYYVESADTLLVLASSIDMYIVYEMSRKGKGRKLSITSEDFIGSFKYFNMDMSI